MVSLKFQTRGMVAAKKTRYSALEKMGRASEAVVGC